MGMIGTMVFGSISPAWVIPFDASMALWGLLMGALAAAAFGIWLSVPSAHRADRQGAPQRDLRLMPQAAA